MNAHERMVSPDDAGIRVDKWLAGQGSWPRSQVKELILAGQLRRNGEIMRAPDHRIEAGEHYRLDMPDPVRAQPEPEAIALSILYEDEHLIALDKPAGLVSHPAPGAWSGTLVNALLHHCGDNLSGIGGVMRPGIVHRLDKGTSGVMIVARTQQAHVAIAAMFASHAVEKVYLALTVGAPPSPDGVIETGIGRSGHDRRKMTVTPGGRKAITRYSRLRSFGADKKTGRPVASLIECRPQTGRTHQIRVHMAHVGAPLIGDPLYGGRRGIACPGSMAAWRAARDFPRQALHAHSLSLAHPVSGEKLRFATPPPEDFTVLISDLEHGTTE